MNLGKGTFFALALTATAPVCGAATVYVSATTEDSVGGRLVYEVREQIRRSSAMDLASSEVDAGYVIRILALKNHENMTAYSWVLTTAAGGGGVLFLNHGVGTCGAARIRECAGDLVAGVDETQTIITDGLTHIFRPATAGPVRAQMRV